MVRDRASRTAAYVAFLRALGDRGLTSVGEYRDATARALLPARWVRLARAVPRAACVVRHVDLLVQRALAIDAEIAGAQQLVILGAGFDGRAHRMHGLDHVFEVDHPATQAIKRQQARRLALTCRQLTYVACDFERDDLAERLQSAGHRADLPTVWIWEGVTLYLGDEALRATLATIAARSTAESTLVVDYHDADAPATASLYSWVRKLLLAVWREPQIGARSQRVMREELEAAGFRLEKDFRYSKAKRPRLAVTYLQRLPVGV
jgi:methyltransferase (TIGR00027 family)